MSYEESDGVMNSDVNDLENENLVGILALFEEYRAGFEDYDKDVISQCFAYPNIIWQFGKGNVFVDAEDLTENIVKLLDALDQEGVVRSEFEVLSEHVSGEAAMISLAWSQLNDADEVVFEFICHYQMHHIDGKWLIVSVVNEN